MSDGNLLRIRIPGYVAAFREVLGDHSRAGAGADVVGEAPLTIMGSVV